MRDSLISQTAENTGITIPNPSSLGEVTHPSSYEERTVPIADNIYQGRCIKCRSCCHDYIVQFAIATLALASLLCISSAFVGSSQSTQTGLICGAVSGTLALFVPLNIGSDMGKARKIGLRIFGTALTGVLTGTTCEVLNCESGQDKSFAAWCTLNFFVGTATSFIPEISHSILRGCNSRIR